MGHKQPDYQLPPETNELGDFSCQKCNECSPQALRAPGVSYPDVEEVLANKHWEEKLLLPCRAAVQRAPAQPAAHTHPLPASPRRQTGISKQHRTQMALGRGRAGVALPGASAAPRRTDGGTCCPGHPQTPLCPARSPGSPSDPLRTRQATRHGLADGLCSPCAPSAPAPSQCSSHQPFRAKTKSFICPSSSSFLSEVRAGFPALALPRGCGGAGRGGQLLPPPLLQVRLATEGTRNQAGKHRALVVWPLHEGNRAEPTKPSQWSEHRALCPPALLLPPLMLCSSFHFFCNHLLYSFSVTRALGQRPGCPVAPAHHHEQDWEHWVLPRSPLLPAPLPLQPRSAAAVPMGCPQDP